MNKKILSIFMVIFVTGCADSNHSDIQEWMGKQEKELKGKIDVLQPARSFVPTPFNAVIDPFARREKTSLSSVLKDRYSPDMERTKEDLEEYNLENLKMVGTVIQDGKFFGMIKDVSGIINYVTVGNYMGKNFGKITDISEGEIVLDERVKVNDEWRPKISKVYLFEGGASK